ncbi:pyridine nucleotide transhydrogenase [Caballeronia sp. GACF4]|uniref:pyridine nucleotide transhydrogenase n=1 Tax=Caballeronia sp. GACF4 TaxID=2921763 RepID=UPI00202822F5|nr:pyridine nucleotide transhydrogenase [Caballeronia sp. GACF4]
MTNALIGFSGFVGQTLLKQGTFDSLYRSTNIGTIDGQRFDSVICTAAPAQKWIANREPEADLGNIEALIAHLKTIECRRFTLISTVDVFKTPVGVDEDTFVDETDLHAYGKNRRHLEKFVEAHFPEHLIVRLPGLVGPGLRKNVIFDFLNDNNVGMIDSRGVFQFYPMVNLAYDIAIARDAGLKLVHLTAEPIRVADVSKEGFGKPFEQAIGNAPATYDLRTKHGAVFGTAGPWQYSRRETVQAVRAYAQSEPLTIKAGA